MKKFQLFIFVLLANISLVLGQTTIKTSSDLNGYNNIPQEKIYVHHNSSLFYTGEYMYYSVYVINSKTNANSDISKIAYIELVSEQKEAVIKQKIRLENGLGQGDIFFPTSIPSGNYKLICYTNWMKNGGKDHYYHDDISVINPFQGNQKAIMDTDENIKTADLSIKKSTKPSSVNDGIAIQVNDKSYGKRSKVSFELKTKNSDFKGGHYSLSVRKIDTVNSSESMTAEKYATLYKSTPVNESKSINQTFYLPELRGELYTGKVVDKETNEAVVNEKVGVSIPGEEYLLKVANTNEKGVFYFNLEKEYTGSNAIIQVLGDQKENYRVLLDEHQSVDYSNLTFNQFKISPRFEKLILDRSVQSQVENGYFSVKPDSINNVQPIIPSFESRAEIYVLDDYTRFSTVRETMIEIINHVSVRKVDKDQFVFHVRGYDPYIESDFDPLVIIDGLLVQDHNELVDYSAKKIKQISVVRDKYLYGSQIFDGVISMETFDGDYRSAKYGEYITNVEFFKPLTNKNYFHQSYTDENKNNRIPDFRNQLLWEPRVELNKAEQAMHFFTSDNSGDYEIVLEGFTKKGNPVSLREVISVQ
ncbi:MAG: hypothetical protein HRT68_12440 [Flavobacteriaceae bacterium]|nr:hypothetical protein [Flavobacteriaceae bacterium]